MRFQSSVVSLFIIPISLICRLVVSILTHILGYSPLSEDQSGYTKFWNRYVGCQHYKVLLSIRLFDKIPKALIYFAAALLIIVLPKADALADSYGKEFITVFPWNNHKASIFMDIINPDKNVTAKVRIIYGNNGSDLKTSNVNGKLIKVKPGSHATHVFNEAAMANLTPSGEPKIYKGYDKRIYISSSVPVSIVQHNYFNGTGGKTYGDAFAVWPKTMAGTRYAFSLPESKKGGSSIAYILPTVSQTIVSLKVITSKSAEDFIITAETKTGSKLQALGSSSEGLTVFAKGDAPFQIIVAMQQMLLAASQRTDADYGATMLIPVPENDTFVGCASKPLKDEFDVHYMGLLAKKKDNDLFTITSPAESCNSFAMYRVRRNVWDDSGPPKQPPWAAEQSVKYLIDPKQMQHLQQIPVVDKSISLLMQSTIALMQILHFGTANSKGPFVDQLPAYSQYVTGRTYFVVYELTSCIMVFAKGKVSSSGLKSEETEDLKTAVGSMKYIHFAAPSTGLHYVESDDKYAVFITCGKESSCGYVVSVNSFPMEWLTSGQLYDPESSTPDSFGTEFVTLFPWNIDDIAGKPIADIYFYITNTHPYAAAQVRVSYTDFDYTQSQSMDVKTRKQIDVHIPPVRFLQISFPATAKSRMVETDESKVFSAADCRIYVTSDIPVTVLQNNYIMDNLTGDTFVVPPKALAGRRYALTLPASTVWNAINSVYFIPLKDDIALNIVEVRNNVLRSYDIKALAASGSSIYIYNGRNDAFTLYASGNVEFLVFISMQRFYLNQTRKSYPDIANAMPLPIPDKPCHKKPVRDEYDVHYFPFLSKAVGSANLYTITPPRDDCEPFDVVKFSDKKPTEKWHLNPKETQPFRYLKREVDEYVTAFLSNNAFTQVLLFDSDQEWGLYVDFIPAYSQYLTGPVYGIYDNNKYESVIVISDTDTVKVDGKYQKPYSQLQTPFRTVYYVHVDGLKIGLHLFEASGRYMLFTDFRGAPYYGYPIAYNVPSPELLKPGTVYDAEKESPDSIDYEFVTVFPYQNDQQNPKSSTQLSFDVINPHPYVPADVQITYHEFHQTRTLGMTSREMIPMEEKFNLPPGQRYTHYLSSLARAETEYFRDGNIYRYADSRIYIKSDVPVSVIQHNYLENLTGDSFALLPKNMAGQRYALTLPKSPFGCNSIYFIPTKKDARINFTVIVSGDIKNYTITNRMAQGSPLYFYNGSTEAFTLYTWGDAPFLVIISMQKFFMKTTPNSRLGYASTMPTPIPDNACRPTPIKDELDIHYAFLSQVQDATNFFTVTPPLLNCEPFDIVKYSNVKAATKWLIEPSQMQPFYSIKHEIKEVIIGMQSSSALLQMIRFGNDKENAFFADIVPSYSQYVTGRTYFGIDNLQNEFVFVLSDTDTVKIDGQYLKPFGVSKGPFHTIYAAAIDKISDTIHYVEADGKYMTFVTHVGDADYAFAVTFNKYPSDTLKPGYLYDKSASLPDNAGLEFVTVFPWNNDDESQLNVTAELSLDIINHHPLYPAAVSLEYNDSIYEDDKNPTLYQRRASFMIAPGAYETVTFNKTVISRLTVSDIHQLYQGPDTRIYICSDMPISVVEHNYMPDGAGDSFTVLPKTMAGQKFAITLPKSPGGVNVIYFLPMDEKTAIKLNVLSANSSNSFYVSSRYKGNVFYVRAYYGAGDSAITVYAHADAPFLIIVSMRRMLIKSDSTSKKVDFGATMPSAIPENSCAIEPVRDDLDIHYTVLDASAGGCDQYTVTAPEDACSKFTANQLLMDAHVRELQILPENLHPLYHWPATTASPLTAVQCSYAIMSMFRFGSTLLNGSYIDMVPSYIQFVHGRTYFVVRDKDKEQVTLFFDEDAEISLDNTHLNNDSGANVLFQNSIHNITYRKISNLTVGVHYVESDGKYTIFITSINDPFYGYVPAVHDVKDLHIHETTAIPTESTLSNGTKYIYPKNSGTPTGKRKNLSNLMDAGRVMDYISGEVKYKITTNQTSEHLRQLNDSNVPFFNISAISKLQLRSDNSAVRTAQLKVNLATTGVLILLKLIFAFMI